MPELATSAAPGGPNNASLLAKFAQEVAGPAVNAVTAANAATPGAAFSATALAAPTASLGASLSSMQTSMQKGQPALPLAAVQGKLPGPARAPFAPPLDR